MTGRGRARKVTVVTAAVNLLAFQGGWPDLFFCRHYLKFGCPGLRVFRRPGGTDLDATLSLPVESRFQLLLPEFLLMK